MYHSGAGMLIVGETIPMWGKGVTWALWLDGITNSTDMNLSKFQKKVENRKPGVLQSMGSQRVGHD